MTETDPGTMPATDAVVPETEKVKLPFPKHVSLVAVTCKVKFEIWAKLKFEKNKKRGDNIVYAASYFIPKKLYLK